MNELKTIELIYESLVPVKNPYNTMLSVGTVTFTSFNEINLDFNFTSTSFRKLNHSYVEIQTTLDEFEPKTFEDEYKVMGLTAKDLNYDYFASQKDTTVVTEIFTEFILCKTNRYIPVTLKSVQLHFADGSFLDYSDRISVFALAELAEVA